MSSRSKKCCYWVKIAILVCIVHEISSSCVIFRTGKIKGIERFLGAVDTLETHLIEVTSGHAKYEHHHRAIVWRMARLPKEGQGR